MAAPADGADGDADGDADDDTDDDADSAGGTGGWRAELMEAPRRAAVAAASYLLVLLLHLGGRCADAPPLLRRLGVTHRLSPALWAAITARTPAITARPPASASAPAAASASASAAGAGASPSPPSPFSPPLPPPLPRAPEVARYSGAVPPPLLAQLQSAFGARAPFWAETGYAQRGYFSFWQPLKEADARAFRAGDAQASNAVEP